MNDFFSTISKTQDEADRHVYTLMLNAQHAIFAGHFPGRPVVPGVMTLMMARLCAEDAAQLGHTRIAAVKEARYAAPIVPDGKPFNISFTIDEALNLVASVANQEGSEMTSIKATLCKE